MTLRELLEIAGARPLILLAFFGAPPLAAILLRLVAAGDRVIRSRWRYVYSAVVYMTTIPGLFAAVFVAYSLFFVRENLLDVNLLVYVLPILSMILTLGIIAASVDMDRLPGFDRLTGLMVMVAVSFLIAFLLERTRIWIVFGGSFFWLILVTLLAFVLLKWASRAVSGRRRLQP